MQAPADTFLTIAACNAVTDVLTTSRSPVVLVHGLIESSDCIRHCFHHVEPAVYAVDLLGYGSCGSIGLPIRGMAPQVTHVAAYIESYCARRVWLVGHSMGGAIVMLLADRKPELVRGIINVEGNFTRKDAFWSSRIMGMSKASWVQEYRSMKADVTAWLTRCEIVPTPQRIEWAKQILDNQPPETIQAMSRALVEEADDPAFTNAIRRVVERGIEIHLVAGEKSAADWDVPEIVRRAAASDTIIENAGHMIMLEAPVSFNDAIECIVVNAD